MKKPVAVLLFIFTAIILSNACKPNYHNALDESARKYPVLYKDNPINSFGVVRTLTDNKLKMNMTLLQSGYQQIIVLSDSVGRMAAIPFPDNDYCAYWQFCPDSAKNNQYFKAALNRCFNSLGIRGKLHQYAVMDNILISLIGARPVTLVDSSRLNLLIVGKCGQDGTKTERSYRTVIKSMKTMPPIWDYTTYSDLRHARIFQFDIVNDSLIVNAYKYSCVVTHFLRL